MVQLTRDGKTVVLDTPPLDSRLLGWCQLGCVPPAAAGKRCTDVGQLDLIDEDRRLVPTHIPVVHVADSEFGTFHSLGKSKFDLDWELS